MKEDSIEKIRKDCADWGDHTNDEVQVVITRAYRLGIKAAREKASEAFFPWKKCSEDCQCKSCDMVHLNDQYRTKALSYIDSLLKE